MGVFQCELYWRHAPNTCRNFAQLARLGYYDGVKFHRIIKDFMIQTGDPTGTGNDYKPKNRKVYIPLLGLAFHIFNHLCLLY